MPRTNTIHRIAMPVPTVVVCLLIFALSSSAVTAQEILSLSDAIGLALENNYGLRIRVGDDEIATVNNSWGAAGRYPTVNFNLSGNVRHTINNGAAAEATNTTVTPGVSLSWLLFDGFGVSIRKERLETLEELSGGNTAILVEQTIQNIIQVYYRALLARENLETLGTVMELSRDRYDYMQEHRELGNAVTYDVLQAKNAWLEDKSRYLEQEITVNNLKRDLNYLMGVQRDIDYELTEELTAPAATYRLENLREKMLSDNRTLRNQYLSLSLLEEDLRLARSDYWPTLSLQSGYEFQSSRTDTGGLPVVTRDTQGLYAGLTLSLPLFDGGSRSRAVQIAEIEQRIGDIETGDMEHSLINELTKLYHAYEIRQNLLDVTEENLAATELNLELSEERFKAGTINSFNYRDVQLSYLSASLARLQAVYNLIETNTALTKITGGMLRQYGD